MTAGAAVRPTSQTMPQSPGELIRIPLAQLVESPWNPRKHFDSEKLKETTESLKVNGQLTPIVVRPWTHKDRGATVASPYYEIGAGHRRFRAAPLAGLTSLLAVVRPLDDVAFLELLTIENKQREDVTPLDEAAGFRLLMEKAGYDVAKLAARIGLSMKYVYDRLKLLQLVPAAKKLLEAGTITAGHGILLARLSPADQKRTLGDEDQISDGWRGVSGGLFQSEDAEGLGLADAVKARSVRELEQWIRDNVRAKPETLDPFLFPDSAAALVVAKEEKLDVIHITREYRVSDDARDEKTRTYGSQAWMHADGKVEEDFYTGRPAKSKTCEFSRYGFVVAGRGQGEVFKVCVNKDKCAVHWPEQVKKAQARKKAAKSDAKRVTRDPEKEAARREVEQQRERAVAEARSKAWSQVLETRKAAFLKGAKKRIAQFAGVPDDAIVAMVSGDFWPERSHASTNHNDRIQDLVAPELPGNPSRVGNYRRNVAAARSQVGLELYLSLDTDGLDKELDREVEAVAAEIVANQAKAKQPATDPKQATCPQCGAKPGSPCKRPSGHNVFGGGFHAGRGKPAKPPAKKKGGRK